jgi:hypothetical protein
MREELDFEPSIDDLLIKNLFYISKDKVIEFVPDSTVGHLNTYEKIEKQIDFENDYYMAFVVEIGDRCDRTGRPIKYTNLRFAPQAVLFDSYNAYHIAAGYPWERRSRAFISKSLIKNRKTNKMLILTEERHIKKLDQVTAMFRDVRNLMRMSKAINEFNQTSEAPPMIDMNNSAFISTLRTLFYDNPELRAAGARPLTVGKELKAVDELHALERIAILFKCRGMFLTGIKVCGDVDYSGGGERVKKEDKKK